MRVIVIGSHKWEDKAAVYDALNEVFKEHGPFRLVHCARSTGAGAIAHEWATLAGRLVYVEEEEFHAAWETRGDQAEPECSARMVEAGADLVLAFPLPEGSGTQHTMKLAREAGIEVREFEHG